MKTDVSIYRKSALVFRACELLTGTHFRSHKEPQTNIQVRGNVDANHPDIMQIELKLQIKLKQIELNN